MLKYYDGMTVELFDEVEVCPDQDIPEFGDWEKLTLREGEVKKLHPKAGEVSVRYNTGDVHRTTGNEVFATMRVRPSQLLLTARDG